MNTEHLTPPREVRWAPAAEAALLRYPPARALIYTAHFPAGVSASTVQVASVVVVHDRSVLILRRVPTDRLWAGCWDLPGGRVEEGETPLDGALRELREETGLVFETAEQL